MRVFSATVRGIAGFAALAAAFLAWRSWSAVSEARDGGDSGEGLDSVVAKAASLSRKAVYPCTKLMNSWASPKVASFTVYM